MVAKCQLFVMMLWGPPSDALPAHTGKNALEIQNVMAAAFQLLSGEKQDRSPSPREGLLRELSDLQIYLKGN